VKSERGRPTAEQTRFLDHITTAGGCAAIVHSVADADSVLRSPA
jgi:hypothetical protein